MGGLHWRNVLETQSTQEYSVEERTLRGAGTQDTHLRSVTCLVERSLHREIGSESHVRVPNKPAESGRWDFSRKVRSRIKFAYRLFHYASYASYIVVFTSIPIARHHDKGPSPRQIQDVYLIGRTIQSFVLPVSGVVSNLSGRCFLHSHSHG